MNNSCLRFGCLIFFAIPILLLFVVPGLAFYGFSFGVLGAGLALASPIYRSWLKNQKGYIFRLSKLPGMGSDSPSVLAIATAAYIFPLSVVSWLMMRGAFSEVTITFTAAFLGLLGILFLFGYMVSGWGIKARTVQTTNALNEFRTQEAQTFKRIEQLDQIRQLDPVAFERFVGSLFERMGYQVQTTALSGDEGVDLILRKDQKLAIVQCKRYEGPVGQPIVRDPVSYTHLTLPTIYSV